MNTPYKPGDFLPNGDVVVSLFDTNDGEALAVCAVQQDNQRSYLIASVDAQGNSSPEQLFVDLDEAFDCFLMHLKNATRS